mmetsp:Transcript_106255/g.298862  ORF Transcript_106255/g.298862 Transcript_106255/m.298862 type:complete len:124 (+) Transcript_106255:391-762(+)
MVDGEEVCLVVDHVNVEGEEIVIAEAVETITVEVAEMIPVEVAEMITAEVAERNTVEVEGDVVTAEAHPPKMNLAVPLLQVKNAAVAVVPTPLQNLHILDQVVQNAANLLAAVEVEALHHPTK